MPAVSEVSIRSLADLYASIVATAQAHVEQTPLFVSVKGMLGQIPSSNYPIHYNVPLHEDQDAAYLNLPKALVAEHDLRAGDYVQASGRIVPNLYQSRLSFRIEVSDIALMQSPAAIQQERQERGAVEQLKRLRRPTVPFPSVEALRVSVICARASQVFDDFAGQLANMQPPLRLERLDVSMTDATAIANAIAKASGDVIALIRGGGAVEELRVFDSPQVIEALAATNAYRVVGLGHTGDSNLAGLVADFVASTPTAAGAHMRAQLDMRAQASSAKLQAAEHARSRSEHRRQVEALQVELARAGSATRRWPYLAAGVFVGCLLFLALRYLT
ncbi:exodeoxyribonuclease VII large subunit [Variovorax paradoxus]|uniref:exodeoxyribonuclease VII large subunit n=1 Tax=Variovorax paradoxus TaxID=34073 RepID=UPI002789376F|nr:exodeoxyribonuclease VII large subunit [Variovorax paradoxus]MDP9933517.1 exonuclease VII large subunit [Variovorax paradoxus]